MSDTNFYHARQLGLKISLSESCTFDNFYSPASAEHPNQLARRAFVKLCTADAAQTLLYVWGAASCGASHLLQASCQLADSNGLQSLYLPLAELKQANPTELFDGLECCDLLCLDDLDAVSGQDAWDLQLFHLLNRWRERSRGRLVVAAHTPLSSLPCSLPDVISRLGWGERYRLQVLSDHELLTTLANRARSRGLALQQDALQFMAARLSRDPHDWFTALDQLDRASLEQQRKLTIPFIKDVLKI